MKFWIHKNTIESHISASGKAIYFTYTEDDEHYGREWFPISKCKMPREKSFNEEGWAIIDLPEWAMNQKGMLAYRGAFKGRFVELDIVSDYEVNFLEV